jgi:hypothetical protein
MLLQPPAPGHPGPPSGQYWGWFAFHTTAFAPHRRRFFELMALQPHLEAAIQATTVHLRRVDGSPEPRQVWGIHMRCGEGFTPLSSAPDVERSPDDCGAAAPASWQPAQCTGLDASSGTTGMWRDTGVFWTLPHAWLTDWLLSQALAFNASPPPLVLLFSDDPGTAACVLGPLGATTLADVVGEAACTGLADAFGGGPDGEALADFFLMTRCDKLAISNSTYSFTAAMIATAVDAQRCACYRPDPSAAAMVPFDPWDAQPTLKRD